MHEVDENTSRQAAGQTSHAEHRPIGRVTHVTMTTTTTTTPVPIVGSPPPRKVSPGRQFTGKNPPRLAAARAQRIFTGKLSAGGDFSGCNLIMGRFSYEDGDIFIRGEK